MAETADGRDYVVLQQNETNEFVWVDTVFANGAEAACDSARETAGYEEMEGTFVAVPIRNWSPVVYARETRMVRREGQPPASIVVDGEEAAE